MGQIGQRLAQARVEKGLSLEQIQEITKIRLKYLVAIEAEDWQSLPGEVYLRGFLRSYAQVVGLDPSEILGLYQPAPPPQAEPQEPIPVSANIKKPTQHLAPSSSHRTGSLTAGYTPVRRQRKHHQTRSNWVMIVIGVLLVGSLTYFGYRIWNPTETVTPPTTQTDDPPTTPATTPATTPQTSTPTNTAPTVQLIKESATPYVVRYIVKGSQSLELKVGIKAVNPGEAVGECWIDVTSDDRNVGDTMLRSGNTREYTAVSSLRLRLGNPQVAGLEISISGVEVPRLETNEAVDLIFTLSNP